MAGTLWASSCVFPFLIREETFSTNIRMEGASVSCNRRKEGYSRTVSQRLMNRSCLNLASGNPLFEDKDNEISYENKIIISLEAALLDFFWLPSNALMIQSTDRIEDRESDSLSFLSLDSRAGLSLTCNR